MVSQHSIVKVNMLNAKEMAGDKDLSDFDKGKIVMARKLIRNISDLARLA